MTRATAPHFFAHPGLFAPLLAEISITLYLHHSSPDSTPRKAPARPATELPSATPRQTIELPARCAQKPSSSALQIAPPTPPDAAPPCPGEPPTSHTPRSRRHYQPEDQAAHRHHA